MWQTKVGLVYILPCGTPEETGRKFKFALFMLTHWLRLAR